MCDDGDVPLFTEETFAAAADDNEEADTEAAVTVLASRRSLQWCWLFTCLVKLFDPNAKPGQHRSEHRTGTAPSPDRRAPYLEAASNGEALIEP